MILAVLVAQFAVAGGSDDGEIVGLQRQIDKLRAQVAQGMPAKAAKKKRKKKARPGPAGPQGPAGSQGPQGAQGPAGAAPACQGNGSGDAMVAAGAVCIDKYEVSVWSSPTGGTQYGATTDDYPCNDNGQDCTNIYARSVPGVTPSVNITYFQAVQALANVGKRLPTNAEWQQAVAGTQDPGATPGPEDCNTNSAGLVATGSQDNCASRFSAMDMVGNAFEWAADWDEQANSIACDFWPPAYGDDPTCIGRGSDSASTHFPAALIRGGDYGVGSISSESGPFAVLGFFRPNAVSPSLGFRGGR